MPLAVVATGWYLYDFALWPFFTRVHPWFPLGLSCLLVPFTGVVALYWLLAAGRRSKAVPLTVVLVLAVLVLATAWLPVRLMRTLALREFRDHKERFESYARRPMPPRSTPATYPLDAKDRGLTLDGRVHFDEAGDGAVVEFVLYRWDLDNSIGLAKLSEGAALPEGTNLFEKWGSAEPLGGGWYLVEGT